MIIGPDDRRHPEVLQLKYWLSLLGGPLDYKYTTTEQPRGNSHILHSRARILGVPRYSLYLLSKDLTSILLMCYRRLFFTQHTYAY